MHRQFFSNMFSEKIYVERFCNCRRNPFHYAIHEWTNICMKDDGMIEYYLKKRILIFL